LDVLCRNVEFDPEILAQKKDNLYSKISKTFPPKHSFRNSVLALINVFLEQAAQLIILQQNTAARIELYAVLERLVIVYLPHKLAKDKKSESVIRSFIERKTLLELSHFLQELELWEKEDLAFVKRLSRIRNALAHRNYELLEKITGMRHSFLDKPIARINKLDASDDLVKTLELVIKLTKFKRKRKTR